MGRSAFFWTVIVALVGVGLNLRACEQCKCQGLNPVESISLNFDEAFWLGKHPASSTPASSAPDTPGKPAVPDEHVESAPAYMKWSLDTLFEFIKYETPNVALYHAILALGRDTHGHEREFDVSERIGYNITRDLQFSVVQGYRYLQQREIDDAAILGKQEHSNGPGDLDFGIQYRFLHQKECGSPVDLQVFALLKAPTGITNNHRPNAALFETEDQPGTGSFDETIGLSASKRWGEWGASAAYGFTHKGEGSQLFKEGDVNRLSFTGTRKMTPDDWSWKLFLSQGVQWFIENKAVDHGITSPDHGGDFVYAVPGVTVLPNNHLVLTASGTVPIIQQENGFHQKDRFGIQLNVGVRF